MRYFLRVEFCSLRRPADVDHYVTKLLPEGVDKFYGFFWAITRIVDLINSAICAKILFCDEIESCDKLMHFTYLAHMNSAWHKRSRL